MCISTWYYKVKHDILLAFVLNNLINSIILLNELWILTDNVNANSCTGDDGVTFYYITLKYKYVSEKHRVSADIICFISNQWLQIIPGVQKVYYNFEVYLEIGTRNIITGKLIRFGLNYSLVSHYSPVFPFFPLPSPTLTNIRKKDRIKQVFCYGSIEILNKTNLWHKIHSHTHLCIEYHFRKTS